MTLKNIIVNGKTGQETIGGKLSGGLLINVDIPGEEAEKLALFILDKQPTKLKAMLFDYGLDSEAATTVGYVAPGAQAWKNGLEIPVTKWTAQDTADYMQAVETYASLKRTGGGFSFASRLAAWEKKVQAMVDDGATRAFAEKHAGKKPIEKVNITALIDETEKAMLA